VCDVERSRTEAELKSVAIEDLYVDQAYQRMGTTRRAAIILAAKILTTVSNF
jgi:hypothetical protein